MQELFTRLLEQIGEDPQREGLVDTPARAARAMQFLTRGYNEDLQTIVNGAVFESDTDELVILSLIHISEPTRPY